MNGFEVILPFLKPIEHLILDKSISEVMVNGSNRVFIKRDGYIRQVPGIALGERSLTVAVKNIARRLAITTAGSDQKFSICHTLQTPVAP
jgi:Flp pilus assembly CpaF family ATPase